MKRDDEMTAQLLRTAGLTVPPEAIAGWSDEQVRAAEAWAVLSGIAAQSRALERVDLPAFLGHWMPGPTRAG